MSLPKLICDRYLLSPTVKTGRISEIFKATDGQCPGKVVAVKVFKFGLFKDAIIEEAFERESRILSELQHGLIIPLLNFGIEPATEGRSSFLIGVATTSLAVSTRTTFVIGTASMNCLGVASLRPLPMRIHGVWRIAI